MCTTIQYSYNGAHLHPCDSKIQNGFQEHSIRLDLFDTLYGMNENSKFKK
jgi:hypothetical protein